jgi:hypothetical protein
MVDARLLVQYRGPIFLYQTNIMPAATVNKTIGIAIHGACNKTNIPKFVSILNDIFQKCNNSSKYFHKILALIITSKTQ